jgi:hypothetical protein
MREVGVMGGTQISLGNKNRRGTRKALERYWSSEFKSTVRLCLLEAV